MFLLYMCAAALSAGRLIPVLQDWAVPPTEICALYPGNRHLTIKVRSFLDFIVERSKQFSAL
jgi:DNA-binding transcriptional LysR family regulator